MSSPSLDLPALQEVVDDMGYDMLQERVDRVQQQIEPQLVEKEAVLVNPNLLTGPSSKLLNTSWVFQYSKMWKCSFLKNERNHGFSKLAGCVLVERSFLKNGRNNGWGSLLCTSGTTGTCTSLIPVDREGRRRHDLALLLHGWVRDV